MLLRGHLAQQAPQAHRVQKVIQVQPAPSAQQVYLARLAPQVWLVQRVIRDQPARLAQLGQSVHLGQLARLAHWAQKVIQALVAQSAPLV